VCIIRIYGVRLKVIHYGTIPTDGSRGRVLSVIRPAASTEIGSRGTPANTGAPTLSSSEPKDTSQYERQKAAEREANEKICAIASMCVTPEETSQCDEEVEGCGPDPEHGEIHTGVGS
jgi:hypothetical protein